MYKRIIGVVLLDDGVFCRTRNFVVDYHYTHDFIDTKYFDELAFINVTSNNRRKTSPMLSQSIENIVKHSQLPISIGGGIKEIDDIREFRKFGADRYLLNQTFKESDSLTRNSIQVFGKSSIISSINHWGPFLWSRNGISNIKLADRIKEIEDTCGGDILLNSVERDGTLRGLDLETLDYLSRVSGYSFVVSGGLGNLEHLYEALQRDNVVGVCTGNVYHLTSNTISQWRDELIERGLNVRKV